MKSLLDDVTASLAIAANNSRALQAGMNRLADAVADRKYALVEDIRAEMLAAVEGWVDNYVAAAMRVDADRKEQSGRRKV